MFFFFFCLFLRRLLNIFFVCHLSLSSLLLLPFADFEVARRALALASSSTSASASALSLANGHSKINNKCLHSLVPAPELEHEHDHESEPNNGGAWGQAMSSRTKANVN